MPKNMTATVLSITHQLMAHTHATQPMHIASIYADYYRDTEPSKGIASQYMTGRRLLPKDMLTHYHDTANPKCPVLLCNDLYHYLQATCDIESQWVSIYRALIDIVHRLPSEDHPNLIPADIPQYPTVSDTAKLWATVLWYSMVWDHICVSMDIAA